MKSKAIPEVCKNCRYWKLVDVKDNKVEIGACNRFPPSVSVNENEESFSLRPITDWNEFCGEFELKLDS